jgi:hypothetical protein
MRQILVTFTQDVDASLVNETNVTVERMANSAASAGGDSASAAAAGVVQRISAAGVLAQHNAAVLLITPSTALDPGVYRVTVRGTGGGALANMNAVTLGSDTSFEFTVEPAE